MGYKTQHTVLLTDETWAATAERAVLEGKSASAICEFVLDHYVNLADEERPVVTLTEVPASVRQRTIHIDKFIWAQVAGRKVLENRPISAILEQQLRAYCGLE